MKNYMIKSSSKGIITIEASLVLSVFFLGFIFLINLSISVFAESQTKKALNSMALELAHYSYILEELNLLEISATSDEISILESSGKIINKEVIEKPDDIDLAYIYKQFKELLLDKTTQNIKKLLYNNLLKKMAKAHLIKSSSLVEKSVVAGYDGMDFTESKIHQNTGEIELNLKYKLSVSGFSRFKITRNISQTAFVKTNNMIKQSIKVNKSIWHESNFDRGRFFVEYFKKHANDQVIKSGQGLDFFDPSTNTVKQMHSLNIFKPSYSDMNDGNYILKADETQKIITKYYKDMLENIVKTNGRVLLNDNSSITLNSDINTTLILVVPNEAVKYSAFNALIDDLRAAGVSVELFHMEDAL
ncbi:MAG: hypothetical protein GXZ08_02185 [Tissierellia bacterium]|nr:hypothetical protein [Tissierellia bacterium]